MVGRQEGISDEDRYLFIPDGIEGFTVFQPGFGYMTGFNGPFAGLDEIRNAMDVPVTNPGQGQPANTIWIVVCQICGNGDR